MQFTCWQCCLWCIPYDKSPISKSQIGFFPQATHLHWCLQRFESHCSLSGGILCYLQHAPSTTGSHLSRGLWVNTAATQKKKSDVFYCSRMERNQKRITFRPFKSLTFNFEGIEIWGCKDLLFSWVNDVFSWFFFTRFCTFFLPFSLVESFSLLWIFLGMALGLGHLPWVLEWTW